MKVTTNSTLTDYPVKNKPFTLVSNSSVISNESRLHCLELLQESLDLKQLLTNFASLVARIIRPFNVRFQS